MMEKKQIRRITLILTAVVAVLLLVALANERGKSVNTFSECVEAGNPVMESYPRQCQGADGEIFIEDITTSEKQPENANE